MSKPITSDVVAATNEFRKTAGMPPLDVAAYPVPAIETDPSIQAGHAAKQAFASKAAAIRANDTFSDAHKAALIADAWRDTLAELARHNDDFNARRQVRWDHLQTQIPTGPDIPEGASPVERAQLLQMFQTAVEKARSSSADELAKMYADARRFGDEISERAVYVVARSEGHGHTMSRYVADHPELAAVLAELDELRAPTGRGFISQALAVGVMGRFVEPAEVAVAARNATLEAAAGSAVGRA